MDTACKHCDTHNADSARFCKQCGNTLNEIPPIESPTLAQSLLNVKSVAFKRPLNVIGAILFVIGGIKLYIIGYYPNEALLYYGIFFAGGACLYVENTILKKPCCQKCGAVNARSSSFCKECGEAIGNNKNN
jgi:uncharacterized membrane protein YvbJ